MNWLTDVIMELSNNTMELGRQKQCLSAINLFVAYRKLKARYKISTLKEEALLMILNMAYVSPSGEEYDYLVEMMKTSASRYKILAFMYTEKSHTLNY